MELSTSHFAVALRISKATDPRKIVTKLLVDDRPVLGPVKLLTPVQENLNESTSNEGKYFDSVK